jgi:hypothetical protein
MSEWHCVNQENFLHHRIHPRAQSCREQGFVALLLVLLDSISAWSQLLLWRGEV